MNFRNKARSVALTIVVAGSLLTLTGCCVLGIFGGGMCGMKHDEGAHTAPPPATAPAAGPVKPYPIDTCLVTGNKLGTMGASPSIVYQGQEIKFCCPACIGEFQKDPAKYLQKLPSDTHSSGTSSGHSH
ncbi:MAG: hypothetical protein AAB215_09635 [Planctomycetota bacterium]